MKQFKAMVKNKDTKQYTVIAAEYETKKAFIDDLRSNGYAVNTLKVKEADLFDAIIENTDSSKEAWQLCKTIADTKNFNNLLDDHLDKLFDEITATEQPAETTETTTDAATIETTPAATPEPEETTTVEGMILIENSKYKYTEKVFPCDICKKGAHCWDKYYKQRPECGECKEWNIWKKQK